MNRIIAFLSVVAIVVCMAVPAFASEVDNPGSEAVVTIVHDHAELPTKMQDGSAINVKIVLEYDPNNTNHDGYKAAYFYSWVGSDFDPHYVYWVRRSNNHEFWDLKWEDEDGNVSAVGNVYCEKWQYDKASGMWGLASSSQVTGNSRPMGTAPLEDSSHDVKNADGSYFFRELPLYLEVVEVTKAEMPGTLQELGGTMKILVVCGVGCLALLVVLSLFGKRSLIFRS